MKVIDILQNLAVYEKLLDELYDKETAALQGRAGFVQLTKNLISQYSFITLRLNLRTESSNDKSEFSEKIYCQISFEILGNEIVFKELYHENATEKEALTKLMLGNKSINHIPWLTNSPNAFYHSEETTKNLTMADEIASVAYNCTSGDDYRPGFFSEIQISDGLLKMSQTNHMNSRSLNHKDNYSLRKLEFLLPLQSGVEERLFYDYKIGNMKIYFKDSSSANNRDCGEAIVKKIEEILARTGG